MRFQFLLESGKLSDEEKGRYQRLIAIDPDGQRQFAMSDNALTDSLRTLCRLLCKHYGQKVILLIDEYDVPLDKAQQSGCYENQYSGYCRKKEQKREFLPWYTAGAVGTSGRLDCDFQRRIRGRIQ